MDQRDPEREAGRLAEEQEMLAYLLAKEGVVASDDGTIEPRPSEAPPVLSYAQQRLWFLHQLEPESAAYNMPLALHLSGAILLPALERALQELVDRHETLRTAFPVAGGRPSPAIAPTLRVPLVLHDVSHLVDPDRLTECHRLVTEEIRQPFDLATGPLIRYALIRLGQAEHVLVVATHHIVSDGWSMGVLNGELTALYAAFAAGRPSPLPALRIQYADFAFWQRSWLADQVLERQAAYWRAQLEGVTTLELPTDRRRPARQTYVGAVEALQLDPELSQRLRALSQQTDVTLAIAMLAAFKALLHRYTGQEDLVVGSPIANRTRSEIEGLIGFFVNSLVMRTNLSGDPTFRDLLGRVREMALAAYEHQDLPFEQLVQELQPERDPARHPLFQVMFAVQNAPMVDVELSGLQSRPFALDLTTTRFDLEFHVWDRGTVLQIVVFYNTDLFDAATIRRMLGHYRVLLDGVIADPEQRISRLPLMSPAERAAAAGNRTNGTPYPRDATVVELFDAQAARAPEAVALTHRAETLTYAELQDRADQVARHLRARGVGPDVPVGLCLPRGIDMIVGMLGILKAGGAYVVLDPEYPQARLAFLLQDTRAPAVLTLRGLAGRLPEYGGAVLCMDGKWPVIAGASPDLPAPSLTAEHLALVIYTSGSTGRPKGVCLPHRGVVRLVCETNHLQVEPADRVAQVSSATFDASTLEIWSALLNGAALVVIDKEIALAPPELERELRSRAVSVLFLTTALFNQVARQAPGAFRGLRYAMFGGEAADPHAVRLALRNGRPERLLHMYGPAESTTLASWYLVESVPEQALTVPIGWPVSNTELHVLDDAFHPVPVGLPGELYVGGDGLAREYLNQPALTAERFLSDPERGRIYRTGDVVRRREDGALEFMSRRDQQVKLRGYRIEIGEIETVLGEHPAVEEIAVTMREEARGDRRLVAYVVAGAASAGAGSNEWEGQRVADWKALYEQTYGRESIDPVDPTFNITGWDSSYTGAPIPPAEMKEWVETTVERILELGPRQVLEIGCGTGLLLFRLAPHCARYLATDFTATALEQVGRVAASQPGLEGLTTSQRTADDFTDIEPGSFDTVVLNSISQYLPSIEYLLRVVAGAVESTAPGGFVFVGDVRSLPMLEAYHASVQTARAPESMGMADWTQRVREHLVQEEELAVDPAFFEVLRTELPRVSRVEVLVKRGHAENELTRFRYDVVLHVDGPVPEVSAPSEWLDWETEQLSLSGVLERLRSDPDRLSIRRVPDARLSAEAKMVEWLREPPVGATIGAARATLARRPEGDVEPEALWSLARELGYGVAVSYAGSGELGRLDVVFERRNGAADPGNRVSFPPRPQPVPKRWHQYATNPLRGRILADLVPSLRAHAESRLPEYMVPAAFVVLDAMPRNRSGKIDRPALPAPTGRRQLGTAFVGPRNPVEEQLVAIYREVLQLEQVGVHDNFFELGGHSLLATQVMSRIRDVCHRDVPLRELFEEPTVAGLARRLDAAAVQGRPAPPMRRQPRAGRRLP